MHVRKLNSMNSKKSELYLGGVYNTSFTGYKRINYSGDYYFFYQSSVGPAFHFKIPLNINKKVFTLQSQLNTSLLAYALYPSYSSSMTDNILNTNNNETTITDFIFSGKILAINKFQRFFYMVSVNRKINSKLDLKLQYNWELVNIIRQNNFTKASHILSFSIVF